MFCLRCFVCWRTRKVVLLIWNNKRFGIGLEALNCPTNNAVQRRTTGSICYSKEKKLEAALRKFQRRTLDVIWKDRIRNEDETVRAQTELEKVDLIIKERKLEWLGHLLRMDDNRLPREALQRDLTAFLAFLWSSSVPLCCVKSHSKAERWKTKEKLERRYSQPIGMTGGRGTATSYQQGKMATSVHAQCVSDTGSTKDWGIRMKI